MRIHALAAELIAALSRAEGLIDSAAELAYFALLSLFPFGSLALVAVSFVPIEGLDRRVFALFSEVMPPDIAALCASVLRDALRGRSGVLLVVSLLGALWIASTAVGIAARALSRIAGVADTRSYLWRRALGVLVTLAGALLLAVALAALVVGTRLGDALLLREPHLSHIVSSSFGQHVLALLRWTIVTSAIALVITLAYRVLPAPAARGRIWPGVVFATCAWLVVSFAFGQYLAHINSYAKAYGALGTPIALMIWLFLAGVVFLGGEAFNVSLAKTVERPVQGDGCSTV